MLWQDLSGPSVWCRGAGVLTLSRSIALVSTQVGSTPLATALVLMAIEYDLH